MNAAAAANHLFGQHTVKGRDQSLREPEGEDQLGTRHEKLHRSVRPLVIERSGRLVGAYLGNKTLEEAGESFVLGHVGENSEPALGVFEVAVLNTGLDDVQRGRNNQRSRSTCNRGNEVLEPRGLVVVFETEHELLGKGRATEQLGAGCVG